MIYLGSHVSMKAPDFMLGSIKEALSYGANACMIYTGPPSNSRRRPVDQLKIDEAHQLMAEHDFDPHRIIVHAPYIINLANSVDPEKSQFGADFLKEELGRTAAIGADTLVLHPGSHVKAGTEIGIQWIIQRLNQVLDADDHPVNIALETMAGKGSECGTTPEQLAEIKAGVHKQERIRICMDTCHLNDAGYDIEDFDSVLDRFTALFGLENIAVIHVNDSKNPLGAHKDRHANIGQGTIGFEALYRVCHHPQLADVTKILETPYVDGKPPYEHEIEALRDHLPIEKADH
ncbi:MAG: deoxyribonuclease IV [Catenisphaera adipataccumulans]|jgi:deoxyribonuclease-4|uniref:deoxyribonuclease IV n=1 Tax=Catenisphaera adipataccumulans TaxID=700500 RepID=UPI003D8CA11A